MGEWLEMGMDGLGADGRPIGTAFCAVCLGELEAGRSVRYCSQRCRGVLRAWEKTDTVEDGVSAYKRRAPLRAALEERRAVVAAREGFDLDELYANRCERSNGLPPGWLKAKAPDAARMRALADRHA